MPSRLPATLRTIVQRAYADPAPPRAYHGGDRKRLDLILCMRREGKTLHAIGDAVGLSRDRVRQLAIFGERLAAGDPRYTTSLCVRGQTVLRYALLERGVDLNYREVPTQAQVLAAGLTAVDLAAWPNVGKDTLTRIVHWMREDGKELPIGEDAAA